MSRIGNKIIEIPSGVKFIQDNKNIKVSGPKGELNFVIDDRITLVQEENKVTVKRDSDQLFSKKIHGTTRALLANLVTGVSKGFSKKLEIIGTGFKATVKGSNIELILGFSHPVNLEIPKGLSIELSTNAAKNQVVEVKGIDKQSVGQFAAEIRGVLPPEPYKGKGIKYTDEVIRRKAGKTSKK
jgi:large subunit ribosomal protein L6